jgi:hypothetical protein
MRHVTRHGGMSLDVLLSLATFVVAAVGVWAIWAGNEQRKLQWNHEGENALLALGVECKMNLLTLQHPGGYGVSAELRDAALQRALPFLSRLPTPLEHEAHNIAASIALRGRLLVLCAEERALNPSPMSDRAAFERVRKVDADALQQVESLRASLQAVADGIPMHVGPRHGQASLPPAT